MLLKSRVSLLPVKRQRRFQCLAKTSVTRWIPPALLNSLAHRPTLKGSLNFEARIKTGKIKFQVFFSFFVIFNVYLQEVKLGFFSVFFFSLRRSLSAVGVSDWLCKCCLPILFDFNELFLRLRRLLASPLITVDCNLLVSLLLLTHSRRQLLHICSTRTYVKIVCRLNYCVPRGKTKMTTKPTARRMNEGDEISLQSAASFFCDFISMIPR